jgi:hypothetical protein
VDSSDKVLCVVKPLQKERSLAAFMENRHSAFLKVQIMLKFILSGLSTSGIPPLEKKTTKEFFPWWLSKRPFISAPTELSGRVMCSFTQKKSNCYKYRIQTAEFHKRSPLPVIISE